MLKSFGILLVITGEFGRTPRINAVGGRDHWPQLSTLALAGGGLRMGQVIGESTARAEAPKTEPVTLASLLATVMHVLVDNEARRRIPLLPGVFNAVVGRVIVELAHLLAISIHCAFVHPRLRLIVWSSAFRRPAG